MRPGPVPGRFCFAAAFFERGISSGLTRADIASRQENASKQDRNKQNKNAESVASDSIGSEKALISSHRPTDHS